MKRITINIGFITNSSSCIHFFDKRLLGDEQVKAFIDAYGIAGGYVGSDLWHRARCGSFLVNDEQREKARKELNEADFGGPYPVGDADSVTVIYGDEHSEITMELDTVLKDACRRLNKPEWDLGGTEYN